MCFKWPGFIPSEQPDLTLSSTWCWLWSHEKEASKGIVEPSPMVKDIHQGQAGGDRAVPT